MLKYGSNIFLCLDIPKLWSKVVVIVGNPKALSFARELFLLRILNLDWFLLTPGCDPHTSLCSAEDLPKEGRVLQVLLPYVPEVSKIIIAYNFTLTQIFHIDNLPGCSIIETVSLFLKLCSQVLVWKQITWQILLKSTFRFNRLGAGSRVLCFQQALSWGPAWSETLNLSSIGGVRTSGALPPISKAGVTQ